jgi:hypothetical protein
VAGIYSVHEVYTFEMVIQRRLTQGKLHLPVQKRIVTAMKRRIDQDEPVRKSSALTKKPVFGNDTGKFKVSTTNIYDMMVTTCSQGFPMPIPAWPYDPLSSQVYTPDHTVADVPFQNPKVGTAVADTYQWFFHDLPARATEQFYRLDRMIRTDAVSDPYWLVQTNSLRAMGVEYGWSEEAGSPGDHYRRSYLSFKIDAQGFNCCDPSVFNTMCQQYGRVKQGPYSVTFHFTDPPMGNVPVTREYPVTQSNPAVAPFIGKPTVEHRALGVWQYILIPPRKLASVKLASLHGRANWDRLIDMGFKPRNVKKAHRIWCSNGGIDDMQMEHVMKVQEVQATSENNYQAEAEVSAGVLIRRSQRQGKWIKHKSQPTESACQWFNGARMQKNTPFRGSMRSRQFESLYAQGYDCCPFGSAIVFCFLQYHGGTPGNAVRQSIPIEIHVDSYTKFSEPLLEQLDIDQLGKNYFVDY